MGGWRRMVVGVLDEDRGRIQTRVPGAGLNAALLVARSQDRILPVEILGGGFSFFILFALYLFSLFFCSSQLSTPRQNSKL